jgi:hypothetical protein
MLRLLNIPLQSGGLQESCMQQRDRLLATYY